MGGENPVTIQVRQGFLIVAFTIAVDNVQARSPVCVWKKCRRSGLSETDRTFGLAAVKQTSPKTKIAVNR